MPKQGFNADRKALGRVLKSRPIAERIHEIADAGASKVGGHVEDYVTDRAVSAIVVGEADQALDGAATKAASETGLRYHG